MLHAMLGHEGFEWPLDVDVALAYVGEYFAATSLRWVMASLTGFVID